MSGLLPKTKSALCYQTLEVTWSFRKWLGGLNEITDNCNEMQEPVEGNGGNSLLSVGSAKDKILMNFTMMSTFMLRER